ncbi:2-hydroxyacid dehydrogenase [Kingella negevensis]|uniref:Phenyllactate dehydrogenase n=1 Tax=Kingella negevensis TaxID=1522312 RepID=A0A238HEQ0_9NEIS|nr:2-hydroxyacid dehydrogenase [Kingella negevensis]MDK4683840.1 2-hydroxyacid dehydrogenase [Kingella negevensis]MDK4697153.1 2-hydroxyacid dehydrogenase [Kingella negevensis]MDK4708340.1 2-hydroxyacid dehydrogenase [Kingella negevensis]MDK4709176.1 2-hydroxyacid dehydrogenase [Kingella negevensis]SNB51049.1 Phenyllactate dehydrogenase [Kingella negevensis]
MTFKVTCYGVRPNEVKFFKKLNKYGYELNLVESLCTHDNIEEAKGSDAVIFRGNCKGDRQNLEKLASWGIKYAFTRTVGFNHIDLEAAKELGLQVARVPSYSPNAIAELALTLAMSLLRNVAYTVDHTHGLDFRVTPIMFSKEIRNCKVGILGTGCIGLTEAKLFKGLGADVYGFDVFQSDAAKEVVTFLEMDELLAQCDVVSVHVPYFKGENDKMINADFLAKMKDGAILVNTARGELQDNAAIVAAIKSGKLAGFGTDVLPEETKFFFKKFDSLNDVPDDDVQELINLYPKVLITPHVGSNTDEALSNMIETSYDNLNEVLTAGTLTNSVLQ